MIIQYLITAMLDMLFGKPDSNYRSMPAPEPWCTEYSA